MRISDWSSDVCSSDLGLFAVYTYVASTMISVTHVSERLVPVVLAIFGIGMTIGNLAAAWAADRAQGRTAVIVLLWSAASLALFPLMAGNIWSLSLVIFLIGCGGGLGRVLGSEQRRVGKGGVRPCRSRW